MPRETRYKVLLSTSSTNPRQVVCVMLGQRNRLPIVSNPARLDKHSRFPDVSGCSRNRSLDQARGQRAGPHHHVLSLGRTARSLGDAKQPDTRSRVLSSLLLLPSRTYSRLNMSPAHLQAQDPADGTPVKEVAPFLKSLRLMLHNESPQILRWTSDGNAFEIHDMAAMTGYVLPKYFKHRKYASFQRQLNYFHFRKWTKSRAVVCTFSNQFFQRDQPALTWRITRKRSLSPAKSSTKPEQTQQETQALSTPDPLFAKQIDHLVTVQTALPSQHQQLELFDEGRSLAWIDVLYPELDLGLFEDNDPTGTDCFFSTSKLLSL
ncbi:hypothetical protein PI126_g6304 [Phytophthora idaei]|nr:hypothetical protein PI126_g6304 [Phytophthora idaei]